KTIVVSFNDSSGLDVMNISGLSVSRDDGGSWRQMRIPNVGGFNLGDGVVTVDTRGNFYYATLMIDRNNRSLVAVSRSTNDGINWSVPVDGSTTAGRPEDFQDKEWITVDRSPS